MLVIHLGNACLTWEDDCECLFMWISVFRLCLPYRISRGYVSNLGPLRLLGLMRELDEVTFTSYTPEN